jgi:hypothetical protein
VTLVGLAATAKSCTVYEIETEWVRPLLVPVTVTVYEPAAPEHDNDDVALEAVALRGRTEGVRLQFRPFEGETVVERATFPAKPSNPVAITVVEPAAPARAVTLVEVAVSPKSWTVYVTVADAELAPFVPVTVTV